MKIVTIVPSQEALASAGVRIRYHRIARAMGDGGSLTVSDIGSFDPRGTDCDALIVCKCFDARSLIAAELAARRGAIVGVDLFDDYFSQAEDSRLTRYRTWLEQMLEIADFATCSTSAMASVVARYRPNLPVHVIRDPAPVVDPEGLAATLAQKLTGAKAEQRLRLCWFGIGDNPNFRVGLSDIAAFADSLVSLSSYGVPVELSILTNSRALDAAGLAAVAALPVPASVKTWSEAREAAALRNAFAVFLPVNSQSFSVAKSDNRVVTALSAGCQILSAGYPLYASFDQFIYRNPGELAGDFAAGRVRLAPGDAHLLVERLEEIASAANEAASLIAFLNDVGRGRQVRAGPSAPVILVHGAATTTAAHAMVHAAGGLSVGTPFCSAPLEFDAVFEASAGSQPVLLVSRKALLRLLPEARSAAAPFGRIGRRKFWQVGARKKEEEANFDWAEPSLSLQLALYERTMRSIFAQLNSSFGGVRTILSETSALPFHAAR